MPFKVILLLYCVYACTQIDFRNFSFKLHVSAPILARLFLGGGLLVILFESFFFDFCADLAHSKYWIRAFLGVNFFPTEVWFIFAGNLLMVCFVARNSFRFPAFVIRDGVGIYAFVGFIFVWYVYGVVQGNDFALECFREFGFTAFSIPPILYFAPHVPLISLFKRFSNVGVIAILLWCPITLYSRLLSGGQETVLSHNSFIMVASFFIPYFFFSSVFISRWNLIGVVVALMPFVAGFAKPMLGILFMSFVGVMGIAGYVTENAGRKDLTSTRMKLILGSCVLGVFFCICLVGVNFLSGNRIVEIVRTTFLKERLKDSGEVFYGDLSGGRMAIWAAALESWEEKPILGHGLGAIVRAFSSGWVEKWQYHNYFFQILNSMGLMGTVFICAILVMWFHRILRRLAFVEEIQQKIVFASMIVFVLNILFFGLYGHSLSYPPSSQMFWLCVGFLSVLSRTTAEQIQFSGNTK